MNSTEKTRNQKEKVKIGDLRGEVARKIEGFICYSYCIPKT